MEEDTGDPIRLAQVWLQTPQGEDLQLTVSAADGTFTLEPERQGRYRVQVRREGYSPSASREFVWDPGAAVSLELEMSVNPIEIDGVEVEAQADIRLEHQAAYAGLYRRAEEARTVGRERVYLRNELEPDDSRTIAEYVAGKRVPGLSRSGVVMEWGRPPPAGMRRACLPQIIWGGSEASMDVSDRRLRQTYLQMKVREIEAIELYGNAREAPLGIRPSPPGCGGVIVLWPRRANPDPDGGRP